MSTILNALSSQAAELLNNGQVGIIPTDTVYGIACKAANQETVARLYKLKEREHKPGTVIAATVDQLVELGLRERYLKPVATYWPGAVSVIIPNHGLEYLHLGTGGLAVRIPDSKELRALLEKTGPLLTTSANSPGEPTANDLQEAQQYFGESIDFYVDGGSLAGRQASTVIRVVDDEVEVLREGIVKINSNGEIDESGIINS